MVHPIRLRKVPLETILAQFESSKNEYNLAWLIQHGCSLSTEYRYRYDKEHSCEKTLFEAKRIFHKKTDKAIVCYGMADNFTRAMPDEFKYDDSIDTFTAYKMYVSSKTLGK